MNIETGAKYPSLEDALAAGEELDKLIFVEGTEEQINLVSQALREKAERERKRKAKRKQQKASRKRNR